MTTLRPVPGPSNADDGGTRRHGEYKVPGGKLVVVDFDVVDRVLTIVSVSGDFFLEPDEALVDINTALDGLPADTVAAAISAAAAACPPTPSCSAFPPTPWRSPSAAP